MVHILLALEEMLSMTIAIPVLPFWRPRLKSSSADYTLHNPPRSLHKNTLISREPFTTYDRPIPRTRYP